MSAVVSRVAVFSTGGTIASRRSADGAASLSFAADDLVAAVLQFANVANIEAVTFRQVASSELTVPDMIELAERIGRAVTDGSTGTVITQGTNTSPLARDLGCVVVFNDQVHLPLFVRKTHTSNPATFRSPLTGPIGWIAENQLRIALRPVMRHHIAIQGVPTVVPSVGLVKVTLKKNKSAPASTV
jgi:L-asparaginase